jgi:hypothetical protein
VKPRISVDFNTMNMLDNDRVLIGSIHDGQMNRVLPAELHDGMLVVLFDDELEVEAVVELVEYRPDYIAWQALPDWSTRRDLPIADEL